MKIINNKGKLFGLINIVDLLVLLALLAAVGGLFWKGAGPTIAGSEAKIKLAFDVRVRGVHGRMEEEIRGSLEKETRVIAGNDVVPDAHVTGVKFEPYIQQVTTAEGRLVDAMDPTRKDAIFTVEAVVKKAQVNKVGPQEVRAGLGYYLKTRLIEFSTVIEKVREETVK